LIRSQLISALLYRSRLLSRRHKSKVCTTLQHAHAHPIRDPASFGNRRATHREFWHLFLSPQAKWDVQDLTRMSIFGHSMGGHGALCTYLASKAKHYRSASAFSPISNPTNAPWGQKAFAGYLQGGIHEAKEQYDATELIGKHSDLVHILIDYVRCNCSSSRDD
jgi:S-formylglutathione hydrolase FrmB